MAALQDIGGEKVMTALETAKANWPEDPLSGRETAVSMTGTVSECRPTVEQSQQRHLI